MNDFFQIFGLGCAGSLCFEIIKVYEYSHRLTEDQWQNLPKSKLFWLIFFGMILASGFFSWAMNSGQNNIDVWRVIISGIAGRSVMREGFALKAASAPLKMGNSKDISIKELF